MSSIELFCLSGNNICNSVCFQKFIPSEFGSDADKVHLSGMDYGFYSRKAEIRRLIEAEGIPYTIILCNFFMSYLLPSLVQPGLKAPPRDEVTVFGDGNTRGYISSVFTDSTVILIFHTMETYLLLICSLEI